MSELPILEIRDVSKAFPNVQALAGVSLDVRAGEVIAFMGENGAGKSTLLKILSGDYQRDAGTLTLDGKVVNFAGPRDARHAGVRVIYQEPEIVPYVTVAENIYIGELPVKNGHVDFGALNRTVRETLAEYGFDDFISPDTLGNQLAPAQRHVVEIMRALKDGLRVLALDEPTSSMTEEEADRLFRLIERLRAQGIGIIYVSHRLHEIMKIADRIAVLRDGKLVGVTAAAETSEAEIVRMMVGRDLSDLVKRERHARDTVVLKVEHLSSPWHRDVSFEIRAGEVVGFAGLIGAGRTELAKVIFGDLPRYGGTVSMSGKAVTIRNPGQAIAAGMGLAPEDRKGEGLVLVRSVIENVVLAVLGRLAHLGILNPQRLRAEGAPLVERLAIKTPSLDQEVSKLSGGNQQKVVLARWLASHPSLLILDEPTRGIDVGAKAEIYRLIEDLAAEGIAIMLISSEMPELLRLTDRILVVRNGAISGELKDGAATEEGILRLAMAERGRDAA